MSDRAKWWVLAVGLVASAGIAWRLHAAGAANPGAAGGPSGAANGEARVIPVLTAIAEKKDVPIYLEGLGNVTPLQTVVVRSQVDGRLDAVAFKEGQTLKKGELIAQVDPRPFLIQLHQGEAALARDSATLKNNQLNLARYTQLRKENLIAQQQLDDQRAAADTAGAAVTADQATIESARLNLDYARIHSPIDGVTGVRQVDPGNVVHASDPNGIVVVTQLDPISVAFTLPEDDLPRVSKAMATEALHVVAFARDGVQKLGEGTLLVIDNAVNTQTATIKLKAVLPNGDHSLWPNAFVKARLELGTHKGALVVPTPAVQRGASGVLVYVVGPDKTAQPKAVVVETISGELTLLRSGIAPGDEVVVDGQSQLRPGSKVAPRPIAKVPRDE